MLSRNEIVKNAFFISDKEVKFSKWLFHRITDCSYEELGVIHKWRHDLKDQAFCDYINKTVLWEGGGVKNCLKLQDDIYGRSQKKLQKVFEENNTAL